MLWEPDRAVLDPGQILSKSSANAKIQIQILNSIHLGTVQDFPAQWTPLFVARFYHICRLWTNEI
jgi:hypothetical protein